MKIKNKLNPKYTQISLYVIGTTAAIFILYQISGQLGTILASIGSWISWILSLLTPVFWGLMLAYLLTPLTNMIEKRLANVAYYKKKNKSPRTMAVVLTFIVIVIGLSITLTILISSLTNELTVASADSFLDLIDYTAQSLDSFYTALIQSLKNFNIDSAALQEYVNNIGNILASGISGIGSNIVNSVQNISSFITSLIFTVIFSAYFLSDGKRIAKYWHAFADVIFSEKIKSEWSEFLKEADRVFSGYIRGQMIDALFMFVVISVTLSIIGVKYAVIIGVLAGFGNLIPYVGPFIAYGSTILVTLVSGDYKTMLIALIALFIVQGIDGNIVNPKLLGNNVDIHPMYVVISLIIGQAAFGLVGMLFAVPVAALVKVLFEKAMNHLYERKGIESPYKDEE